jgi:anthranilate synthase component 1
MYHPSKSEFIELAQTYNLIPIYREIIADVDTPVSAFKKLGESDYGFLLESVEGGEKLARYSFLGNDPFQVVISKENVTRVIRDGQEIIRTGGDPLQVLESLISAYRPAPAGDLPYFYGGAVGFVGYDAVRYFENIPQTTTDDLGLPELIFVFTDTILIFDHLKHRIKVVANTSVGNSPERSYDEATKKIDSLIEKLSKPVSLRPVVPPLEMEMVLSSNISAEEYMACVEKAKEYILAGDIFQVVLSHRFSTEIKGNPFDIYRVLRTINPSPYMGYLKFGDLSLIASSPELLVKVTGKSVETRPLAGTRPRGSTEGEDQELERELLADQKEKAEHIMLVDLGRNDLGRVCTPGTVEVRELMAIERYSHVMHIVSDVRGELAEGKTAFDVLRAAFPAGTVSGAPKIRAMEIIDELEKSRRGPYAGIFGYFSFSGNLDTGITIRTIVVSGDKAYVQAGAGIVADSKPEREFQETVNKAQALLTAVHTAEVAP